MVLQGTSCGCHICAISLTTEFLPSPCRGLHYNHTVMIEHVETESCASDPSKTLPNEAWCAPPAVHLQIIALLFLLQNPCALLSSAIHACP